MYMVYVYKYKLFVDKLRSRRYNKESLSSVHFSLSFNLRYTKWELDYLSITNSAFLSV